MGRAFSDGERDDIEAELQAISLALLQQATRLTELVQLIREEDDEHRRTNGDDSAGD